ncbi:hypothetical protein SNEBB_009409 [Seison nebaliae]|nr:hypothetical protein SNEBB_009409 [Seison nebaliae]
MAGKNEKFNWLTTPLSLLTPNSNKNSKDAIILPNRQTILKQMLRGEGDEDTRIPLSDISKYPVDSNNFFARNFPIYAGNFSNHNNPKASFDRFLKGLKLTTACEPPKYMVVNECNNTPMLRAKFRDYEIQPGDHSRLHSSRISQYPAGNYDKTKSATENKSYDPSISTQKDATFEFSSHVSPFSKKDESLSNVTSEMNAHRFSENPEQMSGRDYNETSRYSQIDVEPNESSRQERMNSTSRQPSDHPNSQSFMDPSVQSLMDPSVQSSKNPSIHPDVDPSVHSNVNPSHHSNVDSSINSNVDPSKNSNVDPSVHSFVDPSGNPVVGPSVHSAIGPSSQSFVDPSVQSLIEQRGESSYAPSHDNKPSTEWLDDTPASITSLPDDSERTTIQEFKDAVNGKTSGKPNKITTKLTKSKTSSTQSENGKKKRRKKKERRGDSSRTTDSSDFEPSQSQHSRSKRDRTRHRGANKGKLKPGSETETEFSDRGKQRQRYGRSGKRAKGNKNEKEKKKMEGKEFVERREDAFVSDKEICSKTDIKRGQCGVYLPEENYVQRRREDPALWADNVLLLPSKLRDIIKRQYTLGMKYRVPCCERKMMKLPIEVKRRLNWPDWEFEQIVNDYSAEVRELNKNSKYEDHPMKFSDRFCVVVRKRPITKDEKITKEHNIVTIIQNHICMFHIPRIRYNMDVVLDNIMYDTTYAFDESQDTDYVYKMITLPLLRLAFEGRSVLFLVYGADESGKKFTTRGEGQNYLTNDKNRGIYGELGVEVGIILDFVENIMVEMSVIEIYNNQIYDLMNKKQKAYVTHGIGSSPGHVIGVTFFEIKSMTDFVQNFKKALNQQHSTRIQNVFKTRSHLITQLLFKTKEGNILGRASILEMASSENAREDQITDRTYRNELMNINQSVFMLKEYMFGIGSGRKSHELSFKGNCLNRTLQSLLRSPIINKPPRICLLATINPCHRQSMPNVETMRYLRRLSIGLKYRTEGHLPPLIRKLPKDSIPRWNYDWSWKSKTQLVIPNPLEQGDAGNFKTDSMDMYFPEKNEKNNTSQDETSDDF